MQGKSNQVMELPFKLITFQLQWTSNDFMGHKLEHPVLFSFVEDELIKSKNTVWSRT